MGKKRKVSTSKVKCPYCKKKVYYGEKGEHFEDHKAICQPEMARRKKLSEAAKERWEEDDKLRKSFGQK